MDKRLVTVQETVATAEDVAFQPTLTGVFWEHLHHTTLEGQITAVLVLLKVLTQPDFLARLIDLAKFVGLGLVRTEQSEGSRVVGDDVPKERGHVGHAGGHGIRRLVDLERILAEVGHPQRLPDGAPVSDGVGAHAARASWAELLEILADLAVLEDAIWLVALHPLLENLEMLGLLVHVGDGHLMGTPEPFQELVVDLAWTGPALGTAKDDDGPPGPEGLAGLPGLLLELPDLQDTVLQCGGHSLVHGVDIVALNEIWFVAVATEQILQLQVADTGEDCRVVDLVTVQVQYGKNSTVGDGIEELGAVPWGCQGTGLGLTITHHCQGNQVGVVEDSAEGVGDGVTQLTTLVNTAWCFRSGVRANSAREGELLEEPLHALLIFTHLRINLAIGTL